MGGLKPLPCCERSGLPVGAAFINYLLKEWQAAHYYSPHSIVTKMSSPP